MNKQGILLIVLLSLFSDIYAQDKNGTRIEIQLYENEFVLDFAINKEDSFLKKAYHNALKLYEPDKNDFTTILTNKLLEQEVNCKLSKYFLGDKLSNKVGFSSTNEDIIIALREETENAKNKTLQVLKKRLEKASKKDRILFGFFDNTVEIRSLSKKNSYLISIDEKIDSALISEILYAPADFGFWETYKNNELWKHFEAVHEKLKQINNQNQLSNTQNGDSLLNGELLFSLLQPAVSGGQGIPEAAVGIAKISDTAMINKLIALPYVKSLFPMDLEFLWEKPINSDSEYLKLIAVKSSSDGPVINGKYISEAHEVESGYGYEISITMNEEGAKIWQKVTRANIGRQIAIVINNAVYSYPVVNSEISGGKSTITGNFTKIEASFMANLINAGNMPKIRIKIISIE